jgi:hypothetical protein
LNSCDRSASEEHVGVNFRLPVSGLFIIAVVGAASCALPGEQGENATDVGAPPAGTTCVNGSVRGFGIAAP